MPELRERLAAIAAEMVELEASAHYNDAEAEHNKALAQKLEADAQVW